MTDIRALPLELFPPSKGGEVALVGQVTVATQRYVELLEASKWSDLLQHVVHLGGLAERLRTFSAASGAMLGTAADCLRERDRGLKDSMAELASATGQSAESFRATMLQTLQSELGQEAGQQAFDQILAGDHALFRASRVVASQETRTHDLLASCYLQLSALARRASWEAVRNLAYATTAGGTSELQQGDEAVLAALSDDVRRFHDRSLARLHGLLDTGDDLTGLRDGASAIDAHGSLLLEPLASVLGGYIGLAIRTSDGATRRHQMRIALDACEQAERLMVLLAYTALLRVETEGRDAGRFFGHERRRVKTRQPGSGTPQGQAIEIGALGTSLEQGTLVQLEGEVRNLRIVDDPSPPKFSTLLDLTDSSTGQRVLVRAHMFSLANNNVADGSYVRLNGFVRKSESWLSDPVGIDIDRVNLGELHRTHWYDDIVYRVRSSAPLYLDEMNMFFTPGFSEQGA